MGKATCAILLSVSLFAGCVGLFFEEPSITLREIHVRQLSLNDASIVFVAEIRNPNGYALRLQSLDCTVHLDGREVGGGSLDKEVSVPASSSAPVEIPVTARFGSLGGVVKLYVTGRDLPYKIEGKALVKAGLFDRTFPFSRTGVLSPSKPGS
ncbi:MAG: LEA type 2 family protein [Syntrophobacterales bacterium]|nr:LEA type 2 family protein [Syntrophobacterales bacterium]